MVQEAWSYQGGARSYHRRSPGDMIVRHPFLTDSSPIEHSRNLNSYGAVKMVKVGARLSDVEQNLDFSKTEAS